MPKKERSYSVYTREAAALLGQHIQLARKTRKITEQGLADRIGISRATLQKIEKGDLKCELGFALEAAAIVGVKLFDESAKRGGFAAHFESARDKLALLPRSIRKSMKKVDDEF